ncbi:MAG: PilZ domain-containing protein [Actinomycetota bacterium]|nr:PilZ domain-containing protein [Actinomycetota bacterium]
MLLLIVPGKRQFQRFIVKLPAKVSAGDRSITGITVRVSRKGFFVRAQNCFSAGTPVIIDLSLSDTDICQLKGAVKYVRHYDLLPRLNGMGIELSGEFPRYAELIMAIEKERG